MTIWTEKPAITIIFLKKVKEKEMVAKAKEMQVATMLMAMVEAKARAVEGLVKERKGYQIETAMRVAEEEEERGVKEERAAVVEAEDVGKGIVVVNGEEQEVKLETTVKGVLVLWVEEEEEEEEWEEEAKPAATPVEKGRKPMMVAMEAGPVL